MPLLESFGITSIILLGIITIALSIECDKQRKRLEEKNSEAKSREDLTNTIVHELRAPLTAIKDAAALMQDDSIGLEKKKDFLDMIHSQSKLLLDQITSFLDASKLDSGKLTIEKSPTNVKSLLEEQLQVFIPEAHEKNINLTTSLEDHMPMAVVDPLRINQVINNLLSNSLKFTPEKGSITVEAKVVNGQTTPCIRVSVSDTGIGIPKERQGKLFSKFFQLEQNNDRIKTNSSGSPHVHAGTGLGLYIVKGIIEEHGGSVLLESEINKGTTVSFTLPV